MENRKKSQVTDFGEENMFSSNLISIGTQGILSNYLEKKSSLRFYEKYTRHKGK